ncbi:hypothetical protein EIP91_001158 [Steccherinum ochraceum]|uniref:Uncharacterized protein n=1 Tax=Steccherinum ochraceum TaxID=92696 RepID=A0A4R0REM5_9APHY|nr:hypothetical protein EIP91_001158 [Steccherinum ochraceum]
MLHQPKENMRNPDTANLVTDWGPRLGGAVGVLDRCSPEGENKRNPDTANLVADWGPRLGSAVGVLDKCPPEGENKRNPAPTLRISSRRRLGPAVRKSKPTANVRSSTGGLAPHVALQAANPPRARTARTRIASSPPAPQRRSNRVASEPTQSEAHATAQDNGQARVDEAEDAGVDTAQDSDAEHDDVAEYEVRDDGSNYCALCLDRGGRMFKCEGTRPTGERCNTSICGNCSQTLQDLPQDVTQDYMFLCFHCERHKQGMAIRYKGFFKRTHKEEPYFTGQQGIELTCASYAPRNTRFHSPRVLIIDAHLASIYPDGLPADLAFRSLRGIAPEAKLNVGYTRLAVNLGNGSPREVTNHARKTARVANNISKFKPSQVILFVATHSNDLTGDLSFAENAATSMKAFFATVIGTDVLEELRGIPTTIFLLCCGGVTRPVPLTALNEEVGLYGISHLFAFTAPRFFPPLMSSHILQYIHHVFIQGRPPSVEQMIFNGPYHLGQQTGIVHLSAGKTAKEYLWTQDVVRPYGKHLPIQCKACGSVYAWEKGKSITKSAKSGLRFCCGGTVNRVDKSKCAAKFEVFYTGPSAEPVLPSSSRRSSSKPGMTGKDSAEHDGQWLVRPALW